MVRESSSNRSEAGRDAAMIGNQERRRVLLGQHERLRASVAALCKAADEVLAVPEDYSQPQVKALRGTIEALQDELEDHLVTEEALLRPVLARIDAWGPLRLGLMQAEHAHLRATLKALRADQPSLEPHALARGANTLAGDVLAEMVDEKRELLDTGVLDEDTADLDAGDA
jgi:iron-sulfur cluster repair protein YtfE (RIC family)